MALIPFTVTVIDHVNNPNNTLANTAIEIRTTQAGEPLAQIYSDDAGANPIPQPGAQTNSLGVFYFYAESEGDFDYKAISSGFSENISGNSHNKLTNRNAVGAHDKIYRRSVTVAQIENGDFEAGSLLVLSDRNQAKVNIVSSTATPNGSTIIDAGAGKRGELVIETVMYTSQFGVKTDVLTAQNEIVQIAVDAMVGNWLIHDVEGITYISVENTDIRIPSNSYIAWMKNSQFKALPTALGVYRVLYLFNTSDTVLWSPYIVGDRDDHAGVDFENGHCIEMSGTSSVTLDSPRLTKAWGDGLYVTGRCINTNVNDCLLYNNRRNGISVIDADGFFVNGGQAQETIGTNPQAGIDLEPNNPTQALKNVVINNFKTLSGVTGISVATLSMDSTSEPVDIIINNHRSVSDTLGILVSCPTDVKGTLVINDPHARLSLQNGIKFDRPHADGVRITVNRPVVLDNNPSNSTSPSASAAILTFYPNNQGTNGAKMGNVEINEPRIYSSTSARNRSGIYFQDSRPTPLGYGNIKVNNPQQIETFTGGSQLVVGSYVGLGSDTMAVTDARGILATAPNGTNDITPSQWQTRYSSVNYTGNGNARLSENFPVGAVIKFTKDEPTYTLRIVPTLADALPTLTTPGGTLDTTEMGATITLEKYSATSWRVVNQVGTWVGS